MKNAKIILGVSAGIAAYKAFELLRLLVKEGADVRVVMSANAGKFVTALTFEALSGNPVYQSQFDSQNSGEMEHIRVAENADLLIVAPATASILGKMAQGLADDALSSLHLAYKGAVLIAPAMNEGMWKHPAVRENIGLLKARGVEFVDPNNGELACGVTGPGRLADTSVILDRVRKFFYRRKDLSGIRFLITAGPTHEPLDPVRYLSNPSSGKMGYAISQAAINRGAEVTLITASNLLKDIVGVKTIHVSNTNEMFDAVKKESIYSDILIMAAAVSDWTPASYIESKIKKTKKNTWQIDLIKTPDILKSIKKKELIKIGFSAETDDLIVNATKKLKEKELDFIVANDITEENSGFSSDDNKVILIDHHSSPEELPLMSKYEVGNKILDKAVSLL